MSYEVRTFFDGGRVLSVHNTYAEAKREHMRLTMKYLHDISGAPLVDRIKMMLAAFMGKPVTYGDLPGDGTYIASPQ